VATTDLERETGGRDAPDTGAMLECAGDRKSYGETAALDGVDLSIKRGEIFGLLGPNGAGKTTLVSIISTLLALDGGSVRVGGYDIRSQPRQVRAITGLAPQDTGLYDPLNARENLEFFGGIYGLHGKVLRDRIDQALEVAGLGDQAKKTTEKYSGGMKRRLSLAIALLHRPELLLLDEPTAGVDPQSRHHLLDSIRELNRSAGTTVVYTTHYMEEVEELCERVAIIDHGRIVADGAVRSLLGGFGETVLIFRAEATGRLTERLRGEVAAVHFSHADGLFQIGVERLQDALPCVLRIAGEESANLEDLRITKPTLEQVFLSITGRELRD
jgi:ABC-2 type transport system ATP-binding protein